jgi:hypothetical protein
MCFYFESLLIMKIVSPPKLPPIEELVKLVTEKLQSGVMLSAVDEKRRYLHWDKVLPQVETS